MHRLLPILLTLAVLTVAPAAPVPKERPREAYFPTTVGAKWVYQQGQEEYTDEVTAVEEKDGAKIITVVRHRGGGKPSFESKKVSVSDKGVFEVASGGILLDTPDCILPNPPKPGDTYKSRWSPKAVITVYGFEEVEVPAGKYRAVRVDVAAGTFNGTPWWSKGWYAPGIGLVKSEDHTGPKLVLKSFTPGKE